MTRPRPPCSIRGVDATVAVLAELAGTGAALEFGIGTGRIAIPSADVASACTGSISRRAMVAQLLAKPGAHEIGVTIGDFATTRVAGTFTLAYLVYNTIMNVTSQAEQVECFHNVAAHLEPGGNFVIEVGVPDLRRLPPGRPFKRSASVRPTWVSTNTPTSSRRSLLPSLLVRRR